MFLIAETLETVKEILSYRARKQPTFYLRFLAFLPWEYLVAPIASCTFHGFFPEKYLCFNFLKLNRCLELIVVSMISHYFRIYSDSYKSYKDSLIPMLK